MGSLLLGVGMKFSLSLFFDAVRGDQGKVASTSFVTFFSEVTDGDDAYGALKERSGDVIEMFRGRDIS